MIARHPRPLVRPLPRINQPTRQTGRLGQVGSRVPVRDEWNAAGRRRVRVRHEQQTLASRALAAATEAQVAADATVDDAETVRQEVADRRQEKKRQRYSDDGV